MTDKCLNAEVRDALPDLLNGRLSALDSATMNAHVESCAECRAELALLQQIRNAAPLAPAMNAERIASAVPAYGMGPAVVITPARKPVLSRPGLLRIAAAALVVIAGAWGVTRGSNGSQPDVARAGSQTVAPVTPAAQAAAPGLDPQSAAVRPSASGEVQVASLSFVGSTSGLSDADLEQLVTDLEAMEAVPSIEPQSVTTTFDDIGTDQ